MCVWGGVGWGGVGLRAILWQANPAVLAVKMKVLNIEMYFYESKVFCLANIVVTQRIHQNIQVTLTFEEY